MPLELELQGEQFTLLEGGGLFWKETRTLLVADLHLGKGAAFRNRGLAAIPPGSTRATLTKLSGMISNCDVAEVIVLGDLWHAADGCDDATLAQLADFMCSLGGVRVVLVEGNHDRRSGCPEVALGIERLESLTRGPFEMLHEPVGGRSHYVLAGHIHPAVRLVGTARTSQTVPCLWATSEYAVLPSFGSFTGSYTVRPSADDGVWLVTDDFVKECQKCKFDNGVSLRRELW